MNIAIPYENGSIFQHYGKTEEFKIFETQDGKIQASGVVKTLGSGHGALAGFLQDYNVDAIICGGIGDGAKNALTQAGIQIYAGVEGNVGIVQMPGGAVLTGPTKGCRPDKRTRHPA